MKYKLFNNKGLTLIEVLVSILILIIGVLALMTLQSKLGTATIDRTIRNALVDAATSAMAHCQNVNTNPPTSYTYGAINVSVTVSGNCNPGLNNCNNVTVTATAQGKSFSLTSFVCNFE